MQAVLILILFSLLSSIIGGIFLVGGKSTSELTQLRTENTKRFFESIDQVVNSSLTQQNMQASSADVTDPAIYISDTMQLAALADGRWPSSGVDAWGHRVQGVMKRTNMVIYSDTNGSYVAVPVTAIALVSPGADGQVGQALAQKIAQADSIPAVMALDAFNINNDIVHVFNDENAQRRTWENLQAKVQTIAEMAVSQYQRDYLLNGPSSAVFVDLDSDATERKSLGVDSIFADIQRTHANGGHLVIETEPSGGNLNITVRNDTTKPTPWPNFKYVKIVTGNGG